MESFVSSVASPYKWSWSGELWSELLPHIGEGLEINIIELSVSSIVIEYRRASEHDCSCLACATAIIRWFIDVDGVAMSESFDWVMNFASFAASYL